MGKSALQMRPSWQIAHYIPPDDRTYEPEPKAESAFQRCFHFLCKEAQTFVRRRPFPIVKCASLKSSNKMYFLISNSLVHEKRLSVPLMLEIILKKFIKEVFHKHPNQWLFTRTDFHQSKSKWQCRFCATSSTKWNRKNIKYVSPNTTSVCNFSRKQFVTPPNSSQLLRRKGFWTKAEVLKSSQPSVYTFEGNQPENGLRS